MLIRPCTCLVFILRYFSAIAPLIKIHFTMRISRAAPSVNFKACQASDKLEHKIMFGTYIVVE